MKETTIKQKLLSWVTRVRSVTLTQIETTFGGRGYRAMLELVREGKLTEHFDEVAGPFDNHGHPVPTFKVRNLA